VRKAVIPAAGLGTRLLPATKVVPKELLPIVDRPILQFAVEEAAASGIEMVILVTRRDKDFLQQYFARDHSLENTLEQRGRLPELENVRRLSQLAEIRSVYQDEPLGLADAVRTARALIGDEPFAVILPDAVIDAETPCTAQLISCYEKHHGCIVATQVVPASDVDHFGILDTFPVSSDGKRVLRVNALIERPPVGSVPFRYGIFGRYILEPEIFASIRRLEPGFGGELQLTDALSSYSQQHPLYAYCFEGLHYDVGNKFGLLQAAIAFALKDPDLAKPLRDYLSTMTAADVGALS
jgi:UTP--glucose-1-phosphate uridylyltransferase